MSSGKGYGSERVDRYGQVGEEGSPDAAIISPEEIQRAEEKYGLISLIKGQYKSGPLVTKIGHHHLSNTSEKQASNFLEGLSRGGFDGMVLFAKKIHDDNVDYNALAVTLVLEGDGKSGELLGSLVSKKSDIKNFFVENISEIAWLGIDGAKRIVGLLSEGAPVGKLIRKRTDLMTPIARLDEGKFATLTEALEHANVCEIADSVHYGRMSSDGLVAHLIETHMSSKAIAGAGSGAGAAAGSSAEDTTFRDLVASQLRGDSGRA